MSLWHAGMPEWHKMRAHGVRGHGVRGHDLRGHGALPTHFLVLFRNVRDKLKIAALGRQIFPHMSNYFLHAYSDACNKPFGYLLVDMRPSKPDDLRLRTNIFKESGNCTTVYVYK
jgi:hypothetical protein